MAKGSAVVFGWYIVAYLFLAGAGSGAFLVSSSACLWDAIRRSEASERVVRTCQHGFLAAPCLMAFAGLFLLLDVGIAERAWLVLLAPLQSVLSAGAWLVALLTLLSGALAAYALVSREVPRALLWVGCTLGWFLALGVMGYTGFLLSDMVSIDFWHTPWLIALFVVSSLSCGVAVVAGLDAALAPPSWDTARGVWRAGAVLGCVEVLVLAAFIASQSGFTDAARASCELLLVGDLAFAFWGGVVAVGLAAPLMLHAVAPLMPRRAAVLASSLGALAGGFLLRYCIVAAAVFTPIALGAI